MKLIDYLSQARGRVSLLAANIGVSVPFVSQMASGAREIPAERCPAIERATGGAVRCEDLRPDIDWGVLRAAPVAQREAA